MCALLKDAILPNLVQTLEGTPALIHGGPFANIAHGCNSLIATKLALSLSDYTITEAGFGADLGAEKFINIKCRQSGLYPDAVVLVATIRALKYNAGINKEALKTANPEAVRKGGINLEKHIENLKNFKIPVVVALNKFQDDSQEEIEALRALCAKKNTPLALCEVWEKGGKGGIALAEQVLKALETPSTAHFTYPTNATIEDKITAIAQKIYGAKNVEFSNKARTQLQEIDTLKLNHLPICIAKTQYSLSDDPKALGRPEGFTLHVRELQIARGAGFIIALTGNILRMPGLGKSPAAERITINPQGEIYGLF